MLNLNHLLRRQHVVELRPFLTPATRKGSSIDGTNKIFLTYLNRSCFFVLTQNKKNLKQYVNDMQCYALCIIKAYRNNMLYATLTICYVVKRMICVRVSLVFNQV